MKQLSKLSKALVAGAIVLATMATASATPVIGTANLSFGKVAVSLGEIDWNPPSNPGFNPAATYGQFLTSDLGNTGSFAGPAFAGVSGGLIQDMSANPADGNYFPVGIPSNIQNFVSFLVQPGWKFDGVLLAGGTFPSAPYVLTEQGGNVSATISVSGFVCDTGLDMVCDAGDDRTKFNSIFSAQYTNTSIAAMQLILAGGGTLSNNTWSGTLEASRIPEPTSIALFGLALAGLGAVRRRKA